MYDVRSNSGGTGEAFVTYVRWVSRHRNHNTLFEAAAVSTGHDRRATFEWLYRSMGTVASFGRTGRLDFLTMLGKLGLADIEPGSTYMTGATGPSPWPEASGGKSFGHKSVELWRAGGF